MEMKCLTLKDLLSVRTLVNKTGSGDTGNTNDQKVRDLNVIKHDFMPHLVSNEYANFRRTSAWTEEK